MKEQIKKIVEAAEGDEEAKAILAGITPETPAQEALAAVAKAAEKLGLAFDASQPLTDEELSGIGGGFGYVDWGELFACADIATLNVASIADGGMDGFSFEKAGR